MSGKRKKVEKWYCIENKNICSSEDIIGSSPAAQQVTDLALPKLWYRSQLQLRFNLWSGNYNMPQVQP